VRLWGPRRAW